MRGCTEPLDRHATCAIVVDPLWDFISRDGEFERGYPSQNESIRAVLETLTRMVDTLRTQVDTVLCASKYEEGQFGDHIKYLCTSDERRTSMIPREWFRETLTKTDNSILMAGDDAWRVLTDKPHVILSGLTGTSCIRVSTQEILKYLPRTHLYLPKNAIAIRDDANTRQKMEMLYEKWEDPDQKKVHVFDQWENIPIQ